MVISANHETTLAPTDRPKGRGKRESGKSERVEEAFLSEESVEVVGMGMETRGYGWWLVVGKVRPFRGVSENKVNCILRVGVRHVSHRWC